MAAISQALNNGLRILELLAEQSEPQTLSECCSRLGLPKSSAHRLLATLEQRGYVERDGALKYHLGPKLLELERFYDPWLRLRNVAAPVMHNLAERSSETCHLAVLARGHAVYVDKVTSPKALSLSSRIGSTAALHASAVGKALLTGFSLAELDTFINECGLPRLTAKTITRPEDLRTHLQKIRSQGYALDDEEEEVGAKCVGAPIVDHSGKVMAALSLAGLSIDFTQDRILTLAEMVREAAAEISNHLGHAPRGSQGNPTADHRVS
jgi:DNA-binding IclR family transcriptional regulator